LNITGDLNIELQTTTGERPPGGRQCGTCNLCCRLLPVDEIAKPAGQKCRHLRYHAGGCCSIYQRRPEGCHFWSCSWLLDNAIKLPRPDRAHYVIDPLPDKIIADNDGEPVDVGVIQIWCDPQHPLAHRDPRLRAWLAQQAERHGLGAIVRYGESRPAIVIIAPSMMDNKQWLEREGVLGAGVGMWSGSG
jgi:hypothetical protein